MTETLSRLVARYPTLSACLPDVASGLELLADTFRSGGKLLVCGNGGSAADSEHLVAELMKGFVKPRRIDAAARLDLEQFAPDLGGAIAAKLQGALPAIALTSQLSLTSAIANDTGAEMIFAQQIYGLGRPGDALLAISTSGNSANVVTAAIVAKARGLKTLALTGNAGGRLKEFADVCVRAPAESVADIQELHLPIYHAWAVDLEERFFA
jgi:D-sedoheptulose 7-phosphate isomerase